MKKLFSFILAALMLAFAAATASAGGSPFSDVKESRWSYDSVLYAYENGYMDGVGGGRFDPAGTMTRGMVVTVLWRMEGKPDVTFRNDFTDVKVGKYYSSAVIWAKDQKIVNGMSEGKFVPAGKITREQLAAMLYRFAEYRRYDVTPDGDLSVFPDAADAHSYAKTALAWATGKGLIGGVKSGDVNLLDPRGYATREQFAAILLRFDGAFAEEPLEYNEPQVMSRYTEKEYPLVTDADVFVAPDGDDGNPGTAEAPVATWSKAAELARAVKETKPSGDVVVAFKAGEYGPLSVSLTGEDSGTEDQRIVYCRYGDGDVIFNNGFDVAPEEFAEISGEEETYFQDKAAEKIKKKDVSSLLTVSPDDVVIFTDSGFLCEARFPNKYADGTDQLFDEAASTVGIDSFVLHHNVLERHIKTYHTLAGMKVYGYLVRGYQKHLLKVASYDPENKIILIADPETGDYYGHLNPDKDDCSMCFVNVSEELDAPGEYWIDPETKILYVYDPQETLHVPMGGTMIEMDRASDVTIRGLTFLNTAGRFIDETLGHGITVERCRFSGAAANEGLMFRDSEVGVPKDLKFLSNEFENFYGAAVKVNGECEGEHRFDKETKVVFDNNLVRGTNLVYDSYNGVDMRSCSNLTFTHNRFEDCSRGAISFSRSYDVLVEYNDFDSVMKNSMDGGVLYADWSADGRNLLVTHNYFGPATTEGIGKYGFYVDDYTCGAEVCFNLFYNTGNSDVMVHDGRDCKIHDNVSVTTQEHSGGFSVISARSDLEENIGEITWEEGRDSVWSDYPYEIVWKAQSVWEEFFSNVEKYENYRGAILERWPEILNYHINFKDRDDPNFLFNSVNDVRDNVFINNKAEAFDVSDEEIVREYTPVTGQRGYYLTENPLFVDPTHGDYRLRDGAEGFPDIEFEKIGRY